jgi:hypothetical protein
MADLTGYLDPVTFALTSPSVHRQSVLNSSIAANKGNGIKLASYQPATVASVPLQHFDECHTGNRQV